MRIVVASLAGSVGKTTITAHMLVPRMPGAKVIAVDTTNMTVRDFGIPAEDLSGQEFAKLYPQLVRSDSLIVDVGGSKEGREFLNAMEWMSGQDEVDAFIIPSMSDDKDQKAAAKTVELLLAQGVSKEKIRPVFNAVKASTTAEFDYLLGALHHMGVQFSLDASIVAQADFFNTLSMYRRSLQSILLDSTDYKAALRALSENNDEEVSRLSALIFAQKTAGKVNENLDNVFNALFPKAAVTPLPGKKAAATA